MPYKVNDFYKVGLTLLPFFYLGRFISQGGRPTMSYGLRSASFLSWHLLEGKTAILPNPERGRGT